MRKNTTRRPPQAFPPLSIWANQPFVLYHGTLKQHAKAILKGVDASLGNPNTDFGRGFYTTTQLHQARSWAVTLSQQIHGSLPTVIRFTVNRDALAALDILFFVIGNLQAADYWSLVRHYRMTGGPHGRAVRRGWYDVVVGPVAAFWRQRLTIQDCDQVSFHTVKGQNLLNNSNPIEV